MAKKILIETALSLEFAAVKAYLQNVQIVKHPETGTIYNTGRYLGYDVWLVETGAGNVRAADETGRAIAFCKPDYVFFVGVAGSIKDAKLGDVVASSKVIGFEMGKDKDSFQPRPDTVPASYQLEQLAKHVTREHRWPANIKTGKVSDLQAFVQPIAAGEKVVASTRSITYNYLKTYHSDAIAVDMEGNGFLIAARPYHAHAIEVRGISDLLVDKEAADAAGSQPVAAAHAAAFCFEMINQLETGTAAFQLTDTLPFRKKLVDELAQLYPQGPEDNDIWKRAGGDISILVNQSSRKSQWFNAIEKLYQGGGGEEITLTSLFNEVQDDFPRFTSTIFNLKGEQ